MRLSSAIFSGAHAAYLLGVGSCARPSDNTRLDCILAGSRLQASTQRNLRGYKTANNAEETVCLLKQPAASAALRAIVKPKNINSIREKKQRKANENKMYTFYEMDIQEEMEMDLPEQKTVRKDLPDEMAARTTTDEIWKESDTISYKPFMEKPSQVAQKRLTSQKSFG